LSTPIFSLGEEEIILDLVLVTRIEEVVVRIESDRRKNRRGGIGTEGTITGCCWMSWGVRFIFTGLIGFKKRGSEGWRGKSTGGSFGRGGCNVVGERFIRGSITCTVVVDEDVTPETIWFGSGGPRGPGGCPTTRHKAEIKNSRTIFNILGSL
jgi:hypothetical protein